MFAKFKSIAFVWQYFCSLEFILHMRKFYWSTNLKTSVQWIAGCLTLALQPARSHGPIRFMLTSLPANLIGLCDLVADILVSSIDTAVFQNLATAESESHDRYEQSDQPVRSNHFRFPLSCCKVLENRCTAVFQNLATAESESHDQYEQSDHRYKRVLVKAGLWTVEWTVVWTVDWIMDHAKSLTHARRL